MGRRTISKDQIRDERDWLIALSTILFPTTFVKEFAEIEHSLSTLRRIKNERMKMLAERPLVIARVIHYLYQRLHRKIIRLLEKLSVIINEPIHKVDNYYQQYRYAQRHSYAGGAREAERILRETLQGIKLNRRLKPRESESKLKMRTGW